MRLCVLLLVSALATGTAACNSPMHPRKELETYCVALGKTEADPFLRAKHESQMAAIQLQLKKAKVTKDFAKLVRLAAPLHPSQIHDALQGYADVKGVKFSCTKAQQQRRRRDKEKQERLKEARENGADEDALAAAAVDPTYTPPFDVAATQAKVSSFLAALNK